MHPASAGVALDVAAAGVAAAEAVEFRGGARLGLDALWHVLVELVLEI